MPDSEKLFIVRDEGRSSKPVTETRVRKLFESGRVGQGATVKQVGTVFAVPILFFLDVEPEPPKSNPKRRNTFRPVEPQKLILPAEEQGMSDNAKALLVVSIVLGAAGLFLAFWNWRYLVSVFVDSLPAIERVGLRVALVLVAVLTIPFLAWAVRLFVGLKQITRPKSGVEASRDQLRNILGWIEKPLIVVHVVNYCTRLCLFLAGIWFALWAVAELSIWLGLNALTAVMGVNESPVRSKFGLSFVIWLALLYVATIAWEAVYRLLPGVLKYWVETTEQRQVDKPGSLKTFFSSRASLQWVLRCLSVLGVVGLGFIGVRFGFAIIRYLWEAKTLSPMELWKAIGDEVTYGFVLAVTSFALMVWEGLHRLRTGEPKHLAASRTHLENLLSWLNRPLTSFQLFNLLALVCLAIVGFKFGLVSRICGCFRAPGAFRADETGRFQLCDRI